MSQSELKRCGCGGKAILCKGYEPDGHCSYKVAFVKCDTCGASTRRYILDGYYGVNETVRDAIVAWNKIQGERT